MTPNNPLSLVVENMHRGDIGVLPTDTIYGIVGSALREKTVKKIYRLRKRNPKKPMIILIGSRNDLKQFGVTQTPGVKKILKKVWPGKVSVILEITGTVARKKFRYLHRGTGRLAFRMPKPAKLSQLLKETGPLVAPSANFEGKAPARTLAEAKRYFSDAVDFYIDAGSLTSKPSRLIKIENGKVIVLRK